MVRQPDATMQRAPQDNQLMSKHRGLSLKPHLRLDWRGQDGQSETEQPDHSASLGDSVTSSTRIKSSVHTGGQMNCWLRHGLLIPRAHLSLLPSNELDRIRLRKRSLAFFCKKMTITLPSISWRLI
jgi:hypothetical protein